jgi:WhiB family redox-sensing transcriptional regulator
VTVKEQVTMSQSTNPNPPAETTQPWMADGLCREHHPSAFFPSDGVGVDRARRICAECPVQHECLEYALLYRIEHGVWGGASERERRRILRSRRLEASSTPA